MATWKKKLGVGLAALALMAGAVPGTIGTAVAVETGQMLDKGPRWPNKPLHYVELVVIIASLVGLFFVVKGGSDKPASP